MHSAGGTLLLMLANTSLSVPFPLILPFASLRNTRWEDRQFRNRVKRTSHLLHSNPTPFVLPRVGYISSHRYEVNLWGLDFVRANST
uniref:Secreted protein n=2 Tax=Picea TaxID=3328 RepID=A0A101LXM6_PICGL|nr:hypothetical protein ABT39_MTgene5417 [Picea glauca]QHR91474.1 hypothetical protein Q903MT_gene5509 [Picea sitchensis]